MEGKSGTGRDVNFEIRPNGLEQKHTCAMQGALIHYCAPEHQIQVIQTCKDNSLSLKVENVSA